MSNQTVSILIRIPRSRSKRTELVRLLERKPDYYFSMEHTGNFIYVSSEEYARVKSLVTKPKVSADDLLRCWNGR